MSIQAVLLPLFVQVVLTFVLLFWTGHLRVGAVRRGEVQPRDIALREPNWGKRANRRSPTPITTSSNCRCCSTC